MHTRPDPYAYLENLEDAATQQFAETAHAETQARFTASAAFKRNLKQFLRQPKDSNKIAFCQEHNAHMYHFYRSKKYPKGVYRVCSAVSYRSGCPKWKKLFSVADFDEILQDNVYFAGVSHYREQPDRVLLYLSPSGNDAAYTLEFDLKTKKVVENGFYFPAAKNHIIWRDENSVWVCPAWQEHQTIAAGYPREVWLVKRNQTIKEGTKVYCSHSENEAVSAWRGHDPQGTPIDLITVGTFYHQKYLQLLPDNTLKPLSLPTDCEIYGYLAGHLLLHLKSPWQRTKQSYPAGSLVAVKLNKGTIGTAHLLFVPNTTQNLEDVITTKHFVIANIQDNVSGSLKAWYFANNGWHEKKPLPQLPQGTLQFIDWQLGSDMLYLSADNFTTPLTLFALDLNVMELSVIRRQRTLFDSSNIKVQQLYAQSADGTRIPYYHVGSSYTPDTPVLIDVYGGFAVSMLPYYSGLMGKYWLEQGKSLVIANVRGGGEFGPDWHRAAQGIHKHKSVDDLLAVIHDLHARCFSSPQFTAIQGGSNGGLLVASAFVREPQTIGAMICDVPLTDMLRYPYLSAGSSWVEEYGHPEDPIFHDALAALSPYHQLNNKQNYPPAFITTSLSDDRVHPSHALKFYAKLRQLSPHTWLYCSQDGGHLGGATWEASRIEFAYTLQFLNECLPRTDNPDNGFTANKKHNNTA